MTDLGLTHIALVVTDVNASISFYEQYARMRVVNRRIDRRTESDVAWLSDSLHPFAIVLLKMPQVDGALLPESHLGVACESREAVDRLCSRAESEGILLKGPIDSGSPVGYWAYIRAPDGHTLEVSYGQEIESVIRSYKNE
jgi:catechol 2,3-dioxygenase-like lactoylglutathione lyase family enzyme